ncbi:hypothetical protein M501DRAFT_1061940 [Patellaria atrata CBS 101060]|uniref:Uncharacterized protein n=1 Tax=Patellaria atrata CBS 101060 TaxID=1346257 RepID=A0A9P4S113_9PEZI|nr:hypothetical protein M501DRAFT_1061940 [Patellaria atrata CBS 101060]
MYGAIHRPEGHGLLSKKLADVSWQDYPFILVILPAFWSASTLNQQQSFGILSLLGIVYFGSFLRPVNPSTQSDAGTVATTPDGQTLFTGLLNALQGLAGPLETCVKVSFLVALALSTPYNNQPASDSLIFQPWTYVVLAIALTVIGIIAPPRIFSGAARFAYLQHNADFRRHYELLLTGWAYFAFALPTAFPALFTFVSVGILFLSVRAALVVHRHYSTMAREVVDAAAEIADKAQTGVQHGRGRLLVGEEYERQLLGIVAASRRDALVALSVRATDFFECATAAWAAIGVVVTPAEDATKRARDLADAAQDVIDVEKPEADEEKMEELAQFLLQRANDAAAEGDAVLGKLRSAQEAVRTSQRAEGQARTARQVTMKNASEAAKAASDVGQKLKGCSERLYQATRNAEKAVRLVTRASETAVEGDIDAAKGILVAARDAANEVEAVRAVINSAVDGSYVILLGFLQKLPLS